MRGSRLFSPDGSNGGEPTQPDLMGYKSVDDLVAAKRASDAELKRMNERLAGLEQSFQSIQRTSQPARFNTPEEELGAYGVPTQALDAVINQRLQAAFEPIARGMQARQSVVSRYPDYAQHEAEVAKYVSENPDLNDRYQRMFRADPESAMEYAMLKYSEGRRASTPAPPKKSEAAREASIPSSRAGDARSTDSVGDDVVEQAREHYQKTGNPEYYGRARLRQIINPEFYNR